MARAELPPSLQEIRNPTSTAKHIAALKELKHEIIGHEQRKELVVHHGVLGLLVRNLRVQDGEVSDLAHPSSAGNAEGKRRSGEIEWTEEDEVRLQSVQIIGCLAHGGLAFIHPLLAAGVLQPLLARLSPSTIPPRLLVESLRAIYAITEALATDIMAPVETSPMVQVCGELYSRSTIENLKEILAQRGTGPLVDEQITLPMKIISLTLWTSALGSVLSEQYQGLLVKTGVLDLLASRLASLAVKMEHTVHPIDPAAQSTMLPSPPKTSLRHLLEALSCITRYSAYRSLRLLYSTSLLAVFPMASPPLQMSTDYLSFADQQSSQSTVSDRFDYLLPKLQAVQNKNEHSFSKAFPVLGSFSSPSELSRMSYFSEGQTTVSSRTISADEFGSPLIAWLIHIARNSLSLERLAALDLLIHLFSALDQNVMDSWAESSRNRDRTLAFLVVPLLVRIIEDTVSKTHPFESSTRSPDFNISDVPKIYRIKECAPVALAILVEDCPALQKAAVDANAIKLLCQMLKKSFDPVSTSRKTMWSAVGQEPLPELEYDRTCNLGPASLAPEAVHVLKCRAGALKALAAIAQREDAHRKAVIENGIMSCIVDSLVPYPDGPVDAMEKEKEGNPAFVVVEACRLATALSRSISILRTSLIDGGVAKPVFGLMRSGDGAVRGAATDCVTNLVLRFSPMREELLGLGIVGLLCEHAHSANPKMRITALWALKHITDSAPTNVKKSILEELGAGWLIQTMSGESHSQPSSHRSQLATPNAAGERVDILNAVEEEPAMDIDDATSMESYSEVGDATMTDSVDHLRILSVPAQYKARLLKIKQEEESPRIRAEKDDVRIQEQALDVVRNAISDAGPSQPEMIDYLLTSIGSTRLFECLENKLRPMRTQGAYSGMGTPAPPTPGTSMPAGKRPTLTTPGTTSTTANKNSIEQFPAHLYLHASLLDSTLAILIHIANGTLAHRHMILNIPLAGPPVSTTISSSFSSSSSTPLQPRFIDLLLPLFSHPNRKIRVACCWFTHNILWMEDKSDEGDVRRRAQELRKRGFEEVVRRCAGDTDLDVRERARACVDIWKGLLGDGEAMSGIRSEASVERRTRAGWEGR